VFQPFDEVPLKQIALPVFLTCDTCCAKKIECCSTDGARDQSRTNIFASAAEDARHFELLRQLQLDRSKRIDIIGLAEIFTRNHLPVHLDEHPEQLIFATFYNL
jgi:hypothetical protein